MNFLEHLEELRIRLIRAILILGVSTIVCMIFSEYLLGFITRTFIADETSHLALLQPIEGFMVRLKVALVAGLFLSSPLWFAQLWGFISPGLYKTEKRVIFPVIAASAFAFLVGAAFGYWMLSYAVDYFRSFALAGMTVNWSLDKYVNFALGLLVAFGLVFELPLIVYLAAKLGVVTTRQLRKYRRHVWVGVMIIAALVTPPDAFTMIIVSVPLIILYEASILMVSMGVKKSEVET